METLNALSHIRSVIELHGGSRFLDVGVGSKSANDCYVSNQLGYINPDLNIFYFSIETFQKEVCKGFDCQQVLKALREAGALDSDLFRNTKKLRIKSGVKGNTPQSFYAVNAGVLLGVEEE